MIRAAIAARIHYLDLADARSFVAGFSVLDGAARAAAVVALTGASSTPALSNAALDKLTAGWRQVDRVAIAIAPGNRAPRGLSVVRSILSYAGRPVRVFVGRRWSERPGWGLTVRRAMPGLGKRWLSPSETPDLDIIPERFAVRDSVIFRAGLELAVLHLGLLAASLAVRFGLLRSLAPMARLFRAVAAAFTPFGTDRGGMTVDAIGLDARARPIRGTWSLVAEAADGPFVPTLPAIAALRGLADGRIARAGASACVGVLSLEDIEAEFRRHRITSSIRFEHPSPSLYETALGAAFQDLPEPLRKLHGPGWGRQASGMAQIDGANTVLARLAAAAFHLPRASASVAVCVRITQGPQTERWTRDFGGARFTSVLSASKTPGHVIERFGPFAFELGLDVGPQGISAMPVRAWRFGPLPLPQRLAPISIASESTDAAGRFCFDVEMQLPFGLGRLVRYRGWLDGDA